MENSSSNNRFRSAVFNHDVPRQPKLASQPPASALCRSFGQRATSDIPPGPCRARLKQGLAM
ncbi:hypothetical protein INR49_031166 [Caranx melampygus]|nr:hypothetical protein INR49_031166 [Caranx melampygus]